jgi:CheY-like chemotaxis protein
MQNNNNAVNDNQKPENEESTKVILADDDKEDQQIFTEAIEEAEIPAQVTTVDNGQELIDNLKDPAIPNPDIIFLDINMPVKDGKKVLKEIKNDESLKEIPTVILSTSDHPKDVEETFDHGANLYVQKPNSFFSFIKILKKVFELHWAKALLQPIRRTFIITEKNVTKKQ